MDTIQIENRIWVAKNGRPFLGHGRIMLLENIEKEGSINKAAKSLGMSYKRAWQIVNSVNCISDEPLVQSSIGGAGGGGTFLTERGRKIVSEFRRIDNKCRALLRREMENCCF